MDKFSTLGNVFILITYLVDIVLITTLTQQNKGISKMEEILTQTMSIKNMISDKCT